MKMKKLKITCFADGGHSWFSVKRQLLKDLGIEKEITRFSYQKGESVYLEEDCDSATFFDAYAKKFLGVSPKETAWENWQSLYKELFEVKESYSDKGSPVRSYAPYRVNKLSKKDIKEGLNVMLYGKKYTIKPATNGIDEFVLHDDNGARYRFTNATIDAMIALPLADALNEDNA